MLGNIASQCDITSGWREHQVTGPEALRLPNYYEQIVRSLLT
jgi:hypothetical protein